MVWVAISFDSQTPLVIIRGTLTAQRYVDDILRPVLLPFLLQNSGLIFQQYNARPHTARVAMNCLTACQTLPWPARSPALSPIEHVWDMIGRRLHLPGNVDDLTRQLEQIWQELPQEIIRELYESMPRHLESRLEVGLHLIELVIS
ncbi:Transposable element Tcb1 transposase, partial [Stegodyphus mimosarum]